METNDLPDNKKKFLNVIYFVDSSKTRSFNISLSKLNLLFTLVVILIFWSLASVFLVSHSYKDRESLSSQLHIALNTIFEYQSRYDGVYEAAYPRKTRKNKLLADGSSDSSSKNFLNEKEINSDEEENGESYSEENNIALAIKKVDSNSDEKWPVGVEGVSFHKNKGDIELNFAIRNLISPEKAEGYIWSVMTFEDKNGKKTFVGSPKGVKVDDKGQVTHPAKASNWYSIRYYKEKSFYFQTNDVIEGAKPKEIVIGMQNLKGKSNIFRLPVDPQSLKKAEAKLRKSKNSKS